MNNVDALTQEAILRVGEVSGVDGRRIYVKVDKNKVLSDVFFNGDILKNISVNSYIEIRKGFLSIIGKVEGERVEEDSSRFNKNDYDKTNKNSRVLTVSLSGYISRAGKFIGGTRELPLIGNEAYIVTKDKIHLIHSLVENNGLGINIATSDSDGLDIELPIDGLFNSHIAIFGNTGSGKSNTLALLYQELIKTLRARNQARFEQNSKFILLDFNGEYREPNCITTHKTVYNLSTSLAAGGDKIPLPEKDLLEIEILSILSDATDKTQIPFLKRAISFYEHVHTRDPQHPDAYFRNILRQKIVQTLQMTDKTKAFLLRDYLSEILPDTINGTLVDVTTELEWHNQNSNFQRRMRDGTIRYIQTDIAALHDTNIYQLVDHYQFDGNLLTKVIDFLYLQLITDVLANRAQNEHISPVINRLKSKRNSINKIFDTSSAGSLWTHNFVVINLHDVNLEMKKTIPLLLSKKLYSDHKGEGNSKSLTIIVDEAHNILSTESFREAESWKDYRLETFEEIIKEGRKFGVFVTISSQRPNDISPTIISQAHNYFIHRLINHKDLLTISNAVSYIDKLTEESIPTLPTGTCIFSGVASQMPLKINVKPLAEDLRPTSHTLRFDLTVPKILTTEVDISDLA